MFELQLSASPLSFAVRPFRALCKRRPRTAALLLMGALGALGGNFAQLPARAQTGIVIPTPAPVTYTVSKVGKPSTAPTDYSRNVWDMTCWSGKIYIGSGDSTNNTGRTPVWTLDPLNDSFASPFTTNDEQVDEYQAVDGSLWITGHDNVFKNGAEIVRLAGTGAGTLVAKIPAAAHLYSLASFGGALFASGGNWSGSDDVWRSADGGATWAGVCTDAYTMPYINGTVLNLSGARAYQLLVLNGQLFACRSWSAKTSPRECVFRWDAGANRFAPFSISPADLCPGTDLSSVSLRYKRPLTLPGGRVLTLGVECAYDHQWKPSSLFLLSSLGAGGVAKIALPGGTLPCDLLMRGQSVFVLGFDAPAKQVVVYSLDASNPQSTPTEVMRWSAPTFARSFEEQSRTFYFGLGCNDTSISPNTGEIWKAVPAPAVTPPPTPTPAPTTVPTPLPTSTPVPQVVVNPDPTGLSFGLNASYFSNAALSGSPARTRVEGPVCFQSSSGVAFGSGPMAGQAAFWGTRYEGFIEAPISGQLQLWTQADDGVRLTVDGQLVIDDWRVHAPTWKSCTLSVVQGKRYPIRLDFFQQQGGATLQLCWSWPGTSTVLVPKEYLWHQTS